MIKYPAQLKPGDTIAVSAPSNGVEEGGHFLVHKAKKQLEEKGSMLSSGIHHGLILRQKTLIPLQISGAKYLVQKRDY